MTRRSLYAALLAAAALSISAGAAAESDPAVIAEGKALTFDRKKGNCLACHMIEDGDLAGNSGPPMIAMKQRFPDKAKLREQIWDPTARNPQSLMPPFGKHGILSEDELDKVVDYLYTL